MIKAIQAETKNAVVAMEYGNKEVQVGVEKTSASGAALREIIKMSEQVGDMIAQIAAAATEQSATTEEINASVANISNATKESSAAAEQTSKACEDLSGMAFDLQNLVSQFHLRTNSQSVQDGETPDGRPLHTSHAAQKADRVPLNNPRRGKPSLVPVSLR